MATKIIESNIEQLIPDDMNFNEGTEFGQHLIEDSLRKFGAGRSILLDKNNRIIAGNKTIENAVNVGLEDVIIVESDGKKIVAVKRTDIDLDTAQGREMAMADNATGVANLKWNTNLVMKAAEKFNIDPPKWGIPVDTGEEPKKEEPQGKKVISTRLIVECGDVTKLSLLFSELQDRGFKCELKE